MNLSKFVKLIPFFLVLTFSVYSQSNSWRGLTPLVSSRADVEKLLGKPKDSKYSNHYEVEKGEVSFSFQDKICDDGWSVPKDTLVSIWFKPKDLEGENISEINFDKRKFSKWEDDASSSVWRNANFGIGYHFYNLQFSGISFFPRKSDNNLRCYGFPPFAPEAYYFTMGQIRFYNPADKEQINEIYSRIDAELNEVSIDSDLVGYILVYFDKKLPLKAYRQRLSKIRNHIFKYRKFSPGRYKIIEGGMKEISEIEFYVLSKNQMPPAPNPTLPSPQFIKNR